MARRMKSPRKIIHEMDPNLSEKGSTFNIAMVLIAAAQVGPNADKIAKRTKLSQLT